MTTMRSIVLASASPRRAVLLRQLGLEFEVDPDQSEERFDPTAGPHAAAACLSRAKAQESASRHPDALIIAADTFGVLAGEFLGKPHTPASARAMLAKLSGKTHIVITGFTVLDAGSEKTITRTVETKVRFKELTSAQIEAYVATGEPLDKAGAYAIQGKGAVLVDYIEGDYSNVVGLPLSALADALTEFGVHVF
jgi:septum formation protein